MIKQAILLFVVILFLFFSCNHGLTPVEENPGDLTGISGTIFYSSWSAADSIYNLRLVVFKNYPPANILTEVLTGQAIVYPALDQEGLSHPVTSTEYQLELAPGSYAYVVVAQQFGPNVQRDWRAVGQFDTTVSDSLPTAITIGEGELLKNIDINVDFTKLLPQPF